MLSPVCRGILNFTLKILSATKQFGVTSTFTLTVSTRALFLGLWLQGSYNHFKIAFSQRGSWQRATYYYYQLVTITRQLWVNKARGVLSLYTKDHFFPVVITHPPGIGEPPYSTTTPPPTTPPTHKYHAQSTRHDHFTPRHYETKLSKPTP